MIDVGNLKKVLGLLLIPVAGKKLYVQSAKKNLMIGGEKAKSKTKLQLNPKGVIMPNGAGPSFSNEVGEQVAERMSVAAIFIITTGLLLITLIDMFNQALWTIGLFFGIGIISAFLWKWVDGKIEKERQERRRRWKENGNMESG